MSTGTLAGLAGPTRASRLVGKYLLAAENVIVIERRHWAALATPLAVFFGGLMVAIALDIALPTSSAGARDLIWLAWAGAVVYLAVMLVDWWADQFVVTNKRVMLVHGIVLRKVDMMPLTKVTDMRYVRTVPGRLLGYGAYEMESAGQDQALSRVSFVPRPDELYLEICGLLFTPEQARAAAAAGEESRADAAAWRGYGPDDPDPDAASAHAAG